MSACPLTQADDLGQRRPRTAALRPASAVAPAELVTAIPSRANAYVSASASLGWQRRCPSPWQSAGHTPGPGMWRPPGRPPPAWSGGRLPLPSPGAIAATFSRPLYAANQPKQPLLPPRRHLRSSGPRCPESSGMNSLHLCPPLPHAPKQHQWWGAGRRLVSWSRPPPLLCDRARGGLEAPLPPGSRPWAAGAATFMGRWWISGE